MKKMKRRFLALLLCVAMILNISPTIPAHASSSELLTVMYDGDPVDSVVLPVNERIKLKADRALLGSGTYQWQILAYDTIWVDIAGAEGKTVEISYAMIANLLENDEAVIRCKVTKGENVTYSSEVVIEVDYDVATDSNAIEIEGESPSNARVASGSNADEDDEEVTTEPVKVSRVFSLLRRAVEGSTYGATPLSEDTYSVVINYQFEDGTMAATPYTATLAAGSSFSTTVTFPTVQGYLPYLNEVQQNSIDLNYTAIDQNYTYNVKYKPTNVDYTVIYYLQNLNDDNYTEDDRETMKGLTKSTVPEVDKAYDGFVQLLYEKPQIAADGSTVVEVYYDRLYYLMNFDLDGGYGVEPIYARYGAPISDVGTPTKAGYSFAGWSLEGSEVVPLPSTMPAENRTYQAVWRANDTAKVTVVFWGENADDEEYSYIKSSTVNVRPETEFTYSEDGSLVCGQEEHTHNDSCGYACGQEEHVHDAGCYKLICSREEHTHSESCYTCEIVNHTHDTSCYAGVGNASNAGIDAPSNPENGYVAREAFSRDGKVIYINGTWYKYTGNTSRGNFASTTCGKTEIIHTHTAECLGCGKTEHTHSDYAGACYELVCEKAEHTHSDTCGYNCGKTAHSHTSDCYMSGAGLDSKLWKFVKSDTVTVAADGSSVVNVYYDRVAYTFTFTDNNSTVHSFTAKWGSTISDRWEFNGSNGKDYPQNNTSWTPTNSSTYTQRITMMVIMPAENIKFKHKTSSNTVRTFHYYVESLPGDTSGRVFKGNYYSWKFDLRNDFNFLYYDEDFFELNGFTRYKSAQENGTEYPIGNRTQPIDNLYFYYTRNSYDLTFNDGYNDVMTENVKYEASLSRYADYEPIVPSAYEAGSVQFGGWYLNPECTGAEYKLDTHTMPANNVLLYAKWVPVTHRVEFYLDQDACNAGTKLSTHSDITVPHGSKADPTPADPSNGSYEFVGWFYMEDGVEKAFDFDNMPVNKDLKVYGKWSSNVLKPYTIYYKIQDTETQIADPTTGSGLAGITKTFDAKGGSELYADYQEGYFPVAKSHSITLDINATEENDTNVYTFWYVEKEAVPYAVKYLNKETGAVVAPEKTVSDNKKAVVTEKFVTVQGMMPDAYQKRLVVSAEKGAVNEIIFYYVKDTTHAYYTITHYTENSAKDANGNTTWTEYKSSEAIGDIGTIYNADPMTIPGFTYDSTVTGTKTSGELTTDGLELKLYYTRNSYPYQVRYLKQDTAEPLHDPENGTGKYGQIVSAPAKEIPDYVLVGTTPQSISIKIEEGAEAAKNIITFYYKEKEVVISYEVVGPAGCGTVSQATETLQVLSGTALGSTPTANTGFRFVGWFTDEACTTAASAELVDAATNKLTPVKVDSKNVAATYYAKFTYDVADLVIQKDGADEEDTFIFRVENSEGFCVDVKIEGSGSVTLKNLEAGKPYTVTELSDWSWRYKFVQVVARKDTTYTTSGNQITFNLMKYDSGVETIVFTNSKNNNKWVDGNTWCQNIFKGSGETKGTVKRKDSDVSRDE